MSELEQAANERIDEFRKRVMDFKKLEGMNNQQLADFFEVGRETISYFLGGGQPTGRKLTMYLLAMGEI